MSRSVDWAIRLVRVWVRIYTARLPLGERNARRDELESDLWEHVRWGYDGRAHSRAMAAQILARCFLGVPGDLAWRVESRALRRRRGEVANRNLKRSWWIAAPIALGSWMVFAALGHPIGYGVELPLFRTLAGRDLGPLWRAATVMAYMATAAACFLAVGMRDRHPGLTVVLSVPAELLNLTPLMSREITLWFLLPLLSIVTVAGTLYNIGRSVGTGSGVPQARTERGMKPIRKDPARSDPAPGDRFKWRPVIASLVVLTSMLALSPVVAGAERMVGTILFHTPNGGSSATSGGAGAPGVTGTVGIAAAGVGGIGAQGAVGIDPISDGVQATAGEQPLPVEPGSISAQCTGTTPSVGTTVIASSLSSASGARLAISPELQGWLSSYGRNDSRNFSDGFWMNTGGTFGGGIPQQEVDRFLRQGLAAGLSDRQLMDIVRNQSFMHGASDPYGGAGLLEYIEANPALYTQVALFAETAPAAAGWGADSGQGQLLEAIPELGAAYEALAGPLHTSGQNYDTVNQLMKMATQPGYWGALARRRLDEVLTYGPWASGADQTMAQYLVGSGYAPTSPEARAAQRYWIAYGERVQQVQGGLSMEQWISLPAAPTGAARPMAITRLSPHALEQC